MTSNGKQAKIVVGVHGSASSLDALAWAHRQADFMNAELHVVITDWTIPHNQGQGPVPVGTDETDLARAALDKAIEEVLEPADAGRVHRHVLQGHPGRALLDAATEADLLVIGCGNDGSAHGPLSSLCEELMARAPCTVVLVRSQVQPRPSTLEPEVAAPSTS